MMDSAPPLPPAAVTTASSAQTVLIQGKRYRQRPLGPAPFASFEDLSDELDSPPETARVPLPGIKEDPASQLHTPSTPLPGMSVALQLTEQEQQGLREALASQLGTPAPPRIDISRASSSSQHEDSVSSSPDKDGVPQNLGYKEDGAIDLRSSTEELDYIQEPGTVEETEAKRKRDRMMKKQQQLKQDLGDTQSEHGEWKERKDSNCSVVSDIGLLCISGRTSRLSSIGSAASGGSAASHHSGASHLSVGSHMSRGSSRSPSPHKMLLETSFCGSKPAHTQSIDAENAPALVSHVEKPTSRPPSRLRSRSPSPHKMLLETSFCGAKQIVPADTAQKTKEKERTKKQHKSEPGKSRSPKSVVVTAADVVPPLSDETKPKQVVKPAEGTPVKRDRRLPLKVDEISRADEPGTAPVVRTVQRKPINLANLLAEKQRPAVKKKVISIRDLPEDEIYIPLKGPEVDFEEIIRRASPRLKRKEDTSEPVRSDHRGRNRNSPDEIYIPLHSPPKDETTKTVAEVEEVLSDPSTFKQNFDDGIYIPLHSPPKSEKTLVKSVKSEIIEKSKQVDKKKSGPKQYEVCEDGSIFIPLHSPEEERSARTFEQEIHRVEIELQKAREAADRRQRQQREKEEQQRAAEERQLKELEERQQKPATLDLSDGRSRLSQTFPSGRPDLPSGSRTPSPGSSLSRKSSFASLFRKSDVSASPDSPAGSTVRKKSGTFTTILKEASNGLRERSRSRSKSRERQQQGQASVVARTPSFKRTVFTNLFAKKKPDSSGSKSKAEEDDRDDAPQLDVKFTFKGSEQYEQQGDYIIIPLRDPSHHPASDIQATSPEEQEIVETAKVVERPQSPVVIVERTESPQSNRRSREMGSDVESSEEKRYSREIAEEMEREKRWSEGVAAAATTECRRSREVVEEIKVQRRSQEVDTPPATHHRTSDAFVRNESPSAASQSKAPSPPQENIPEPEPEREVNLLYPPRSSESSLQHDSSLEADDQDTVREELVAVSADGVRKLKLPPEPGDLEEDHERKGLVLQESFEDELPYVPTTLPLERTVGVPIVPVKQRTSEVKTFPIDRPRSTTPINPSSLHDYVAVKVAPRVISTEDKMKISLPREDSTVGKVKSPRRASAKGKTWFEFAEAGLASPREYRKSSLTTSPSPPPLPPRAAQSPLSTSAPQAMTWVNFEELPEKRKLPKRITTVPPLRSSIDGGVTDKSGVSAVGPVVYSYVNPEDCQCECHDHNTPSSSHAKDHDFKRAGAKQLRARSREEEGGAVNGQVNTDSYGQECGEGEGGECEECERGMHESKEKGTHASEERDIEERPLLDANSDGENEDSSSRKDHEWGVNVPGSRLEVEPHSHLSDSSYECTSHEATSMPDNSASDALGMKPFGMDLDVHSNRSSIVSQDEQPPSPDDITNSLPP